MPKCQIKIFMPNALKNAKFEQFGMKNANMVTLSEWTQVCQTTFFHFQPVLPDVLFSRQIWLFFNLVGG